MKSSLSQIAINQVTSTASYVSSSCFAWDIVRVSAQIVVSSGTCAGTFVLQGSNDKAQGAFPNLFQPSNWNNIGSATVVIASTTPTNLVFLMPATEVCYQYLRLRYTDSSAASAVGSFNVNLNAFSL